MRRAAFTVLLTAAATAYVAPPSARTSGRATARRFDTSTAPPGRRATVLHFGGPQLDFAVDEETADFVDVSAVFIDSFWADKAEKELTDSQRRELRSGQLDDFKRRYALRRNTRRQAALFVARDGAEIIGCAGVELDGAADDDTLVPAAGAELDAVSRRGRGRDVDIPPMHRGAAAAGNSDRPWGGSRRGRGRDVDIPRRPRPIGGDRLRSPSSPTSRPRARAGAAASPPR